jgi:VanZ family protein
LVRKVINNYFRRGILHIYLILTVIWFVFMTFLSHQNGEQTGKASMELAKKLCFAGINVNRLNSYLRKAAHVFLFFVFNILLVITLKSYLLNPLYGVAAAVIWSWADERTKPFIEGRHFSWFDVGLNVCGVMLGWIITFLFW